MIRKAHFSLIIAFWTLLVGQVGSFKSLSLPSASTRFYARMALISKKSTVVLSNSGKNINEIIKVRNDRQIIPGDYVVHETYGIGRYQRCERVDLTPTRNKRTYETLVVIKYADTDISWYKRVAEKELWLYRSVDSGIHGLSLVVDNRKWTRHVKSVKKTTQKNAMNLLRIMTVRNSYHRLPCPKDSAAYREFEQGFSFPPTTDQEQCFENVRRDMTQMTRPMDRLICGDVGFGKTEVAMRAIYRAVLAGRQVAFLAPTRVLALQHLRVLRKRFPSSVSVALLRGGDSKEKQMLKKDMESGAVDVVVGTHALLQSDVKFKCLGLLVVDEEQRFGVDHKEKLKITTSGVDVLTLSATPIPRTLQISLSGLRDLSLMNSPPSGRLEVKVKVGDDSDQTLRAAIRTEQARKGQVFVVVPFVRDVAPTKNRLLALLPGLRIIEAHGRHNDLEDRIDAFAAQEADVLVATTVIENGIDMPNVNTIVVLQSDRFGISALYQLRGRVGRGKTQAHAFFLKTKNKPVTLEAETRLAYMETFTALGSGYDLSRRDMEMRGYGTIFGAAQSGSRDVGVDLQTQILKSSLEDLQEKIFMPTQVSRVDLRTDMEAMGSTVLGPIPQRTEVESLITWENRLAALVFKQAFPQDKSAVLRYTRAFSEAVHTETVTTLVKEWRADLDSNKASPKAIVTAAPLLLELGRRRVLSIHCRQLGIQEVYRDEGGHVVLRFENYLSEDKWGRIKEEGSKGDAVIELHQDGYLVTASPQGEKVIPSLLVEALTRLEARARRDMQGVLKEVEVGDE